MNLIINLNKPKGFTSHDATAKVKKILRAKKAGHTGTLDPLATGVLLTCINNATRLASYFSSLDKEYTAVMKLGETTDTQDAEGTVTEKNSVNVEEAEIKTAIRSFEGKIRQEPPMFSALKHKGKPLYKYAQKGINISREHREIYIHYIKILKIELPFVSFKTACSKGTYIRTLCHDIGRKLGTGAHLFSLERTAIGPFDINDSLSIEALSSISPDSISGRGIYTMDRALSWMPELTVRGPLIKDVKNGASVKLDDNSGFVTLTEEVRSSLKDNTSIKIKSSDGEFLAVGSFSSTRNIIKMDVVFTPSR